MIRLLLAVLILAGCVSATPRGISPQPEPTPTVHINFFPWLAKNGLMGQATATPTLEPAQVSEKAQQLVDAINAERASAGLRPLTIDSRLMRAAQTHADDMIQRDYLSHTSPEGVTATQRITAVYQPWSWVGEIIAAGYGTPERAVAGWMASPLHRAIILSPNPVHVGAGYAEGNAKYSNRYIMTFGKP